MAQSAFEQSPELTAIAIAYQNPARVLINENALPVVPVGRPGFSYSKYVDDHKLFTLPRMRTAPTAKVNRIEMASTRTTSETYDNALSMPLSFYDANRAPDEVIKPKESATEFLAGLVRLKREVEVAEIVFDADSYATGCKEELTGADQFDETTSKPLEVIPDGLATPLVRPNRLIFGPKAWKYFRSHADIVSAVLGNSGTKGLVSKEAVAQLFELEMVLVGEGWVNTALPGETAVMTRVWGNHIAAVYFDQAAARVGGMTFGATFRFGQFVAGTLPDPEMGLRGGELVKVGESVKPLVVASSAGYFWENAVNP